MLIEFLTYVAYSALLVLGCYGVAHLIAWPIKQYRQKKWDKETMDRCRVYRQTQKDWVK